MNYDGNWWDLLLALPLSPMKSKISQTVENGLTYPNENTKDPGVTCPHPFFGQSLHVAWKALGVGQIFQAVVQSAVLQ